MARSRPRSRFPTSRPPSPATSLLGADFAARLDPVALARRVSIEPDDWQARALRSESPRLLMNCCRQSGKSTVAALVALHKSIYAPESVTLLVSPSLRQSQELFKKVLSFYRVLDRPVPADAESALSLTLANGSRVVSLPGSESNIRAYTADLLVVDEASRVPDDLYVSIRPMIAVSQGRLLALSTPQGVSGWWSEAWHDEAQPWERYQVPASLCPRISPTFLAEEKLVLGEWKYAQEYECKFMADAFSIFSDEAIAGLFTTDFEELEL